MNNKINRILAIHDKLHNNEIVNKKELASEFQVSINEIGIDINDIRGFYNSSLYKNTPVIIKYDNKKKSYVIENKMREQLSKEITNRLEASVEKMKSEILINIENRFDIVEEALKLNLINTLLDYMDVNKYSKKRDRGAK